ncbi:hypothetical protein GCM10018954_024690 [Kutzneria kofuensis]
MAAALPLVRARAQTTAHAEATVAVIRMTWLPPSLEKRWCGAGGEATMAGFSPKWRPGGTMVLRIVR